MCGEGSEGCPALEVCRGLGLESIGILLSIPIDMSRIGMAESRLLGLV